MNRWQRIESLFQDALERTSPERERFLRDACAGDPDLEHEVATLLALDDDGTDGPGWAAAAAARILSADDHDRRLAAGAVVGPYTVLESIGAGAMGQVYRGRDHRLNRDVAIKAVPIDPGEQGTQFHRFQREARALGALNHPNIAGIYDVLERDGAAYLVLEFVQGLDLATRLEDGPLSLEEVLAIAAQMADALIAAHGAGIVHRDLKPANIMLTPDGRVKVLDFGIAKETGLAGESAAVDPPAGDDAARATVLAGTPAYMSPEQARGEPVDGRADVWAFGCVLFELLTRRRAFRGDWRTRGAAAADWRVDWRAMSPDIPSVLTEIIRSCLQPTLADRLPTAKELRRMIGLVAARASGASAALPEPSGHAEASHSPIESPTSTALRPIPAVALFACVMAGALVVGPRIGALMGIEARAVPRSADDLQAHARLLVARIGHQGGVVDSDRWFAGEFDLARPSAPNARLRRVRFLYRQSPSYLVPQNLFRKVTESDPADSVPGMASVTTDAEGTLIRFDGVPVGSSRERSAGLVDWSVFFREARLSPASYEEAAGETPLSMLHDRQHSWRRKPNATGPSRVAAASLDGTAVYFERFEDGPVFISAGDPFTIRLPVLQGLVFTLIALLFSGSALVVWRARRHLPDQRAALRVATIVTAVTFVSSLLRAHHVPRLVDEAGMVLPMVGWSLLWGALSWLAYVALERLVARGAPCSISSLRRLLHGEIAHPLVARDILLGAAVGVALAAAPLLLPDHPVPIEGRVRTLDALSSYRALVHAFLVVVIETLEYGLGGMFLYLLIRRLVRSRMIALILYFLMTGPVLAGGTVSPEPYSVLVVLLIVVTFVAVVETAGALAWLVSLFVVLLLSRLPLTLDVTSWYFGSSAAVLSVVVGTGAYGLWRAVAWGRSSATIQSARAKT